MKNKKINEDAIYKLLEEKEGLSSLQKENLDSWLEKDENKTAYDKNKAFLDSCRNLDKEFVSILESEIQNKQNLLFKFIKPIAASVVFILISLGAYTYNNHIAPVYENTYLTSNIKNTNIKLPDNSSIDLDIKSNLQVTYYKDKRVVDFLLGKAIFSVSKDKQRPFIINSSNARIEVLGTKFEVINLDEIITINVIEGIVRVSHKFNDKIKNLSILKAGDSFSLNSFGKVINTSKIKVENIALWKENLLKFNKTKLKEVLKIFKRYDNKKVEIMDYETSQLKISGVFSTKELNKLIDALPFIYRVKVTKNKDEIKLQKKNN